MLETSLFGTEKCDGCEKLLKLTDIFVKDDNLYCMSCKKCVA
jgi:hypothetical protein